MLRDVIVLIVDLLDLFSEFHEFSFDLVIVCDAFYLIFFKDHFGLDGFCIEKISFKGVSAPSKKANGKSSALKSCDLLPLLRWHRQEMERTRNLLWCIVDDDKDIGDFASVLLYHFVEAAIDASELVERYVVFWSRLSVW